MGNPSPISIDLKSAQQCQHVNARGHRCRMFASSGHDSLCPHHLNQLKAARLKNDQAVAAELLGPIKDFSSSSSVNLFLGNLLKQLVLKRVRRRDAIAQAYICQLLLNTLPHIQRELEDKTDKEGCEELLRGFLQDCKASRAKQDSVGGPAVSSSSLDDSRQGH